MRHLTKHWTAPPPPAGPPPGVDQQLYSWFKAVGKYHNLGFVFKA